MEIVVDCVGVRSENLLINDKLVKTVVDQQARQGKKKCLSLLFCYSCFVEDPSTSELLLNVDKLSFPPKDIVESKHQNYYLISVLQEKSDGTKQKTPLVVSPEKNLADMLCTELSSIYVKSDRLGGPHGESLSELDRQAMIWHQFFGLLEKSRGTYQVDYYRRFDLGGGVGDPYPGFEKSYQNAMNAAAVRPLAEEKPMMRMK